MGPGSDLVVEGIIVLKFNIQDQVLKFYIKHSGSEPMDVDFELESALSPGLHEYFGN